MVEIVDCMKLLGRLNGRIGTRAFKSLMALPPLYDALHFSHIRQGTRLARTMEGQGASRIAKNLANHLNDRTSGHSTLLLSVFPLGAQVVSRLNRNLPGSKAISICTDWSSHSMWVAPGIDLYLVNSVLAESTTLRFAPDAKILRVPIPIRRQFFNPPSRHESRHALGIPEDANHVLLATGAWASAKSVHIAEHLAQEGFVVSVLTGMNRSLLVALEKLSANLKMSSGEIRPYPFIDNVEVQLASCDLVITTPGIVSSEARAVGRRQLILDIVPGHGRENVIAELLQGGTLVSGPDPQSATALTKRIIQSMAEPQPCKAHDWEVGFLNAIESVQQ